MTKADGLLFCLLAASIGLLYGYYWIPSTPAQLVHIHGPDGLIEHTLQEAQTLSVRGALGNSQIEIEQGRGRFKDSPCPHKICVRSGWLSHQADIAACVPNKISVRLVGKQNNNCIDAMSY